MRKIVVVVMSVVCMSACGGGRGENVFLLDPNYPDKLSSVGDYLASDAFIVAADGASILSEVANGELIDGHWRYSIGHMSGALTSEMFLKARFAYSEIADVTAMKSSDASGALPVAEVLVAIEDSGGGLGDVDQASYDFSMDGDADGLPNLDEIIAGADPSIADTDGDGFLDGVDAFPSAVGEWSDTDSDGIGDNEDDDMDGDGISNDDELLIGTNEKLYDTDDDGLSDGDDICPLASDAGQDDFDGDGIGDACDGDSDGDGLSDSYEDGAGTDPLDVDTDGDGLGDGTEVKLGSNPLSADSDGDGIGDLPDNCATDVNAGQGDIDNDGAGDACDADIDADGILNAADNCPEISNVDQTDRDLDGSGDPCDPDSDGDGVPNGNDNCPLTSNTPQDDTDADGDGVPADCDLDDSDVGVLSETDGIFVDVAHGSDGNSGSISHPVASLKVGIARSLAFDKSVYVAAGNYDVSDVALSNGVQVFGGFRNSDLQGERFTARNAQGENDSFKTVLFRNNSSTTLWISKEGVVLSGLNLENYATEFDVIDPSKTLVMSSGSARIEICRVFGNASSENSVGLSHEGGSLGVVRNLISGGGSDSPGSSCMGVVVSGGNLSLKNSIINGGECRFATAVEADGVSPVVVNNTLDGSNANDSIGVARGVAIVNSNPILINNMIVLSSGPDRYPIVCEGISPSGESIIEFNVLANFSETDPAVIGCDGFIYSTADFVLGDADVAGNVVFDGDDVNDLVDASYSPVSPLAIDAGFDVSGYGDVSADYVGNARPVGGAYDIGALEN